MRNGTSAEPSTNFDDTRPIASHSGVSAADEVDSFSSNGVISVHAMRSPSASSSIAWMSELRWPGSVRMSTSTSTESGITLVLVPPWMTVGANVVCVHACAWRASPIGSSSQKSASVSSVEQVRVPLRPEVDALDEAAPRVVDHASAAGTRRGALTISAAVTNALSVRNGCDAWPGVPRTVMRHQYEPFSPTITGRRGPRGVGIWKPPASVTT